MGSFHCLRSSSSTMAFVVHRCALLVGFLLLITQWSHIAAEVVSLTDQTFEHQTQASTGMTTGSWLVLFSIPDCPSCESLKPVIEDLGKDEEVYERGIVLGTRAEWATRWTARANASEEQAGTATSRSLNT